jgi:two-component system sensor histidine kinase BaeS
MRIKNKLTAIFFVTSVALVIVQVLVMQWSIGKGMIDYVNERELKALSVVASSLAELYQQDGDWQKISGKHRRFKNIVDQGLLDSEFNPKPNSRPPNRPKGPRPMPGQNRLNRDGVPEENLNRNAPPQGKSGAPFGPPPGQKGPPIFKVSYALLDSDKTLLAGLYSKHQSFSYVDILVEGKVVGFLAVSKRDQLTAGYELSFVEQQQRYIVFVALGLILIAMLIAIPLAAHFVRPIKRLTAAMSMLTSGDYQQRIDLKRKDEFAQLSRDFNELAATLQQNEQARKRWLADISHELRTPVAVLKGELEAMLDGVRPLSMERIQSSNEEVKQLEKLLDDLHELTRNDLGSLDYRKQSLDLVHLLREEVNHYCTFLGEKGIAVTFGEMPKQANIFGDTKRLKQLFANLFINTAKYAGEGDTLRLSAEVQQQTNQIKLRFEDNGSGVDETDLPKLFDHLFRVENSRNRTTGGSGLGLSICKKIVEAHHGEISAFVSELGGLGILIVLPLE